MNASLTDMFVLGLRLWLGLNVLVVHGWSKLAAPADFIATVAEDYWLPTFSGWFAILAEVLGGAFLALGFKTRSSALCIALVLAASGLISHAGQPWADARELRFTLTLLALYFVISGGGPLSLDAAIARRDRRRSPW